MTARDEAGADTTDHARDEAAALALVSARASLALAQDTACELRWSPAMRAEIAQHAADAIAALRVVCRQLGTDAVDVGERDPWGLAGDRRVA